MRSFLTCPHTNTVNNRCDACGYNVQTTHLQYAKDLRRLADAVRSVAEIDEEIAALEARLGVEP
jgi:hypothetical protein